MDELEKYYGYLKGKGADVPDTFESFKNTLQDEPTARKYYDYVKSKGFDAPSSYDSFSNTFNLKKKVGGEKTSQLLFPSKSTSGSSDNIPLVDIHNGQNISDNNSQGIPLKHPDLSQPVQVGGDIQNLPQVKPTQPLNEQDKKEIVQQSIAKNEKSYTLAATNRLKAKGITPNDANLVKEKEDLRKQITNGDLIFTMGADGTTQVQRPPTFSESIAKGLYDADQSFKDTYNIYTTPEKDIPSLMRDISDRKKHEAHTIFSLMNVLSDIGGAQYGVNNTQLQVAQSDLSTPETYEHSLKGNVGNFLGTIAPDIAITAATGGTSLPLQLGLRGAYFQAKEMGNTAIDLYSRKVDELTKQGMSQEQAEQEASKNLKSKAALAALPNAALNTYLFSKGGSGNIALDNFGDALKGALKSTAKMGVLGAGTEGATQSIEGIEGYKPDWDRISDNAKNFMSMEGLMQTLHLGGAVPKYLRAYAKEAAVQPEMKPFVDQHLQGSQDEANIKNELNNYAVVTAPLRDIVPEDKMAAVGGRTELINNLKQKITEAEASKRLIPEALQGETNKKIEDYQAQIDNANKEITQALKTDNPLKVEKDDLTGEPVLSKEKTKEEVQPENVSRGTSTETKGTPEEISNPIELNPENTGAVEEKTAAPLLEAKAILDKTDIPKTYDKSNPEELIKYIADAALGRDAKGNPIQPERGATEKEFGKELVDAATKAYPKEDVSYNDVVEKIAKKIVPQLGEKESEYDKVQKQRIRDNPLDELNKMINHYENNTIPEAKEKYPSLVEMSENSLSELKQLRDELISKQNEEANKPIIKGDETGNTGNESITPKEASSSNEVIPETAQPSEEQLPFGRQETTGIANRVQETRAYDTSSTPPKSGEGVSVQDAIEHGRDLMDKGEKPQEAADAFKNDKKISFDALSLVRAEHERLVKESNKVIDEHGENSPQAKTAIEKENKWYNDVVQPMKTEWHKIGQTQQGEVNLDTGSYTGLSRDFRQQTGKEYSTRQSEAAKRLSAQVKDLNKQVGVLQDKLTDTLENGENTEKGEQTKKYTQAAKKIADNFRKLKNKPFTFKDENGKEVSINIQGVSWNDLVELGAKAIEKTGEIADGVKAIVDKIKDSAIYESFSDKQKSDLEKQLTEHYKGGLEKTTETKNIKRLEKQLEDLQKGIAKQTEPKREWTDKEKELKDKIQDEKEKLGLMPSKASKPEEKQLTEQERYEDLVSRFSDKKDNIFSPKDAKDIWKYARETYTDNGESFGDMVHKVATDLGLEPQQVVDALSQTKESKSVTDKIYRTQYERNKAIETAKNWQSKQVGDKPVRSLIDYIASPFRSLATLGHGHALLFTHAGINLFDPKTAGTFLKLAAKQFKIVYGKAENYEKATDALQNDPYYNTALKSGLAVDPHTVYDDWQIANTVLKRLKIQGNKGFLVLKMMRMEIFKNEVKSLSNVEKADPQALKRVAEIANHWTGTAGIPVSPVTNAFVFAPNLIVSKFARLTTDPARALTTVAKQLAQKAGADVKITPAETAASKIILKKTGRTVALYFGALAMNQAMLSLSGSKQKINGIPKWMGGGGIDPTKGDLFKFKTGGDNTVDVSSGMTSAIQLLSQLSMLPFESKENIKKDFHGAKSAGDALENTLTGQARNMTSPFGGVVWDNLSHKDFEGNTLPWFNDKPNSGKEKLSTGYYLSQKLLPIPASDAFRTVHDEMVTNGMSSPTASMILGGVFKGAIASTGIKVGNVPQDNSPYTDADKQKPAFKYFIDKGMELPNTSLNSEKVKDVASKTIKPISELPKEQQQRYTDAHKAALENVLGEIKKRGYAYISQYGETSLHSSTGAKKINIDDLNKDQLADILNIAQSLATKQAKFKVFKQ